MRRWGRSWPRRGWKGASGTRPASPWWRVDATMGAVGATMTAYRIVAWGEPPRLTDAPVPEPGPGEVLVEVAGNGLCHSDVTMAAMPAEIAGALGWSLPFTLGHEVGGRIAAAGPGVEGLRRGRGGGAGVAGLVRRVPGLPAGPVSACPTAWPAAATGATAGWPATWWPRTAGVVRLDGLDPAGGGTADRRRCHLHHAVARAVPGCPRASTAVVVGAGGWGRSRSSSCGPWRRGRVVAVDTNPARRAVAVDLGAHEAVAEVGGGGRASGPRADVVLDLVGTDATIAAGLAAVRPYGAFGLVGAAGGTLRRPWFGGLPRDADVFTFRGSSIADVTPWWRWPRPAASAARWTSSPRPGGRRLRRPGGGALRGAPWSPPDD